MLVGFENSVGDTARLVEVRDCNSSSVIVVEPRRKEQVPHLVCEVRESLDGDLVRPKLRAGSSLHSTPYTILGPRHA